ncbi:outer membrane lipoprotein chaperone LolA [Roseateles oligotrophus]|uniref:Outer-membrane lipoprotein carrier protein n=1 Tax=Roseateles oligotrophus TaxID=1769250 RepID=A0ABT2YA25_9BURK|nr:outer membrane lipoprotein chaperone LolA [Roseateles oligotrophus]MCV2367128.1 outer membrane lipoprotein chaperone LolA [Roseateles oligotrophus]
MMRLKVFLLCGLLSLFGHAHADAVAALKDFVREAKSGRAQFSQTVTSPDGSRTKVTSGSFEFQRPNQFRFAYLPPTEQLIVADGQKVWMFDPGLNQASSHRMSQALGATPAALLAGGNLERDFTLKALPSKGGLDWVQALPKQADGGFQSLKVGFKGRDLAALEIVDGFGQSSRLDFSALALNPVLAADRFRFTLPAGADLLEQ